MHAPMTLEEKRDLQRAGLFWKFTLMTASHAGADSRHAVEAEHDKHAAEHHAAHPANAAAAAWLAVHNVLLVIAHVLKDRRAELAMLPSCTSPTMYPGDSQTLRAGMLASAFFISMP